MDKLSFQKSLFNIYAIASCIMILKAVVMSWLTVVRMMQVKAGFARRRTLRRRSSIPIQALNNWHLMLWIACGEFS